MPGIILLAGVPRVRAGGTALLRVSAAAAVLTFSLAARGLAGENDGWKWSLDLAARATYDSNAFKLSDDQIDRLEDDRAADQVSGRFDDMESVDDFILTPSLRLCFEGPGIGGRDLRLRLGGKYETFFLNERKSHPGFGLDVEHEVGADGRLGLDVSYAHHVFGKNYLSDATDLTGSVSADEKVYSAGVHDDTRVEVTYRHRLWKRPKNQKETNPFELFQGQVLLGYENNHYNDPLGNRDANLFLAGLGGDLRFLDIFDLGVDYLFAYAVAPGNTEVMIRNEPDFGVDFNGDGDSLDPDIRTEQEADRTRFEHSFGVKLGAALAEGWDAWLGYDILFQDYVSEERFDASHRGRLDTRHRVRGGVNWEFARHWNLELSGQWVQEDVDRLDLSADEDEDREYERFLVSILISVRI